MTNFFRYNAWCEKHGFKASSPKTLIVKIRKRNRGNEMNTVYQIINFFDPKIRNSREVAIEAKTLDEAITILKLRFGANIKFYGHRTVKK